MASSTSKPRTSSPFRFRKTPSMNQSKAPFPSPSSSTTSSQTPNSGFKAMGGFVGRSLTPSRGKSNIPAPQNTTPPQKFRPSSASSVSGESPRTPTFEREDFLSRAKENISVTVRFRPLSQREIQRGDEIAWYADGDTTVTSELNQAAAYAFDRVFGPATTTRGVYDVAAQHVVNGAMEGVNGTVFAYGVTSSGKTHTMHGDQKSPGIIPLAIKDVFSIIQETPDREFLLRVSYLEIYNEVINDLLDPLGQNLRVREDGQQGTYVEGIKEEVVLSPAHALSLIAAGEEHRHVGSNNFNLFSSRSHTIFTLQDSPEQPEDLYALLKKNTPTSLTIESSPRDEGYADEDITLSQLNLIDLAGSESSKTETTGLRRKEGSFINKSLLTLGTVIAKLSDGKASHIPYRDSKLTRLLQSSLSGHGRISLICTITPASSNNEETHNTLKFAHRAKRIEIHASSNRILDEKSLIKKYQREICNLKLELEQLRRGILQQPYLANASHEDLLYLRQQLEAGQVKMQSRLEEEEQAKAALMGRIQRLTKLILVSTKNTIPPVIIPEKPNNRRRHSFGEEELAYLPDKRRDLILEEDEEECQGLADEGTTEGRGDYSGTDDNTQEEKKSNKKRGMLAWFKIRKSESLNSSPSASFDTEENPNAGAIVPYEPVGEFKGGPGRKSFSRRVEELSGIDAFPEPTQAGDLFSATVRGRRPPPTGTTMADQIDLLREQIKMLAGEVAFCTSSLKRLIEQAANNPDDLQIQVQIDKTKEEIQEKKRQMRLLEQRINSADIPQLIANPQEMSQKMSKLMSQLNEKSFDLEIKSADNRILQEQLESKIAETNELKETIESLQQQLQMSVLDVKRNQHRSTNSLVENVEEIGGWLNTGGLSGELRYVEQNGSESDPHDHTSHATSKDIEETDTLLQAQVLLQAAEIDNLKQEKEKIKQEREKLKHEKIRLVEEKDSLQNQKEKLAHESAYAKELASQAAVELKNLAEEVTKLSFQNAKLQSDLIQAQEIACQSQKLQNDVTRLQDELVRTRETYARAAVKPLPMNGRSKVLTNYESHVDGETFQNGRGNGAWVNGGHNNSTRGESNFSNGGNLGSKSGKYNNTGLLFDDIDRWQPSSETAVDELRKELELAKEKEASLASTFADRQERDGLKEKLDQAKQREKDLENELASMWVLVAKLKKEKETGMNMYTNTETQEHKQEDFRGNGGGSNGLWSSLDSQLQSLRTAPVKDIDRLSIEFSRTELNDSYGEEYWSDVGKSTFAEEDLDTGFPESAFQSLVERRNSDSEGGHNGDLNKPYASGERKESNGLRGKGWTGGDHEGRSLRELKCFIEEDRRRGPEPVMIVSQPKLMPITTGSPNSTVASDYHTGLFRTKGDFEGDIWPSYK